MKGDFTRDSFDPSKHFTRVLQQQGRVQLDADSNEQISIFWHYLRALTRDMLGPYAAPRNRAGFVLLGLADIASLNLGPQETERLNALLGGRPDDFLIGPGHYYVNGLLCENDTYYPYSKHPDPRASTQLKGKPAVVFLDVWERHITYLEDDSIHEVALGGADSASRAKIVWQVRLHELTEKIVSCADLRDHWDILLDQWQAKNRGSLKARAKQGADNTEPCSISPSSQYRGPENQLYRVEIHSGGQADASGSKEGATFKWSRENGSVVFPIVSKVLSELVNLANLGPDARFGLEVGDWVEIVDDDYVLQGKADPLLKVEYVYPGRAQVKLSGTPLSKVGNDLSKHPLVRRWDQKSGDVKKGGLELHQGAALIREGAGDKSWLDLEDGVQIQFNTSNPANQYRAGDYWLIPARTATGDVLWPGEEDGKPKAVPPRGIEHYYAPLGLATFDQEGAVTISDSDDIDGRATHLWRRCRPR
jgi:hypothetical protein